MPGAEVSAERAIEPFLSVEQMSLSDFLSSEKAKTEIVERARNEQMEINRQNRHDGIDKILAYLLRTQLSGKKLSPIKDMLAELPVELAVKPKRVQQVLRGEESDIPKVLVATKKTVSINPSLDWKDLADYPLTQGVCKTFLEM